MPRSGWAAGAVLRSIDGRRGHRYGGAGQRVHCQGVHNRINRGGCHLLLIKSGLQARYSDAPFRGGVGSSNRSDRTADRSLYSRTGGLNRRKSSEQKVDSCIFCAGGSLPIAASSAITTASQLPAVQPATSVAGLE